MEKDLHNDNFKGALFQNFEEEVTTAPEIVWDKIEKELFPKKKNKGILWLSSLLLIGLISTSTYFLFFHLKTSNPYHPYQERHHHVEQLLVLVYQQSHTLLLTT